MLKVEILGLNMTLTFLTPLEGEAWNKIRLFKFESTNRVLCPWLTPSLWSFCGPRKESVSMLSSSSAVSPICLMWRVLSMRARASSFTVSHTDSNSWGSWEISPPRWQQWIDINQKDWTTDPCHIRFKQRQQKTRILPLSPWICSTEMSAEKILALVLSIICWSACRTLSRIRERGDSMSGAVATTLETGTEFVRDTWVKVCHVCTVDYNIKETYKLSPSNAWIHTSSTVWGGWVVEWPSWIQDEDKAQTWA